MGMIKTLVSIDPGMSSGVAIGTYSNTKPYTLTNIYQIEGGLTGFLETVRHYWDTKESSPFYGTSVFSVAPPTGNEFWATYEEEEEGFEIIAEKFTPRQALSLKSAEPLRIEGALVAKRIMPDYPNPRWRQPIKQYFAGGKDLDDRKKRAYAWLKKHGFYVTGKTVGCKDAYDARSSILHAISWLRDHHHRPTIDAYFKKEE